MAKVELKNLDLERLGKRVRILRVEMGWNQKDLADLTGMSQSTVSAIEKGNYVNPPVPILYAIADAAGISRAYMLMLTDDPHEHLTAESVQSTEEDEEEIQMLMRFRRIAPEGRKLILSMVTSMAETYPEREEVPANES